MQSVTSFTEDGGTLTPASTVVGDSPPPKPISIFVKTLTGKTNQINVFNTTPWSCVARMIQDGEGIPPDQQTLISKGKKCWVGECPDDRVGSNCLLREVSLQFHHLRWIRLTVRTERYRERVDHPHGPHAPWLLEQMSSYHRCVRRHSRPRAARSGCGEPDFRWQAWTRTFIESSM